MASSIEQFIAHMKLQELRVQRERLLAAYAEIAQEITDTTEDTAVVQLLYERLRQLRFAGQFLHPEVANLELLLREIDDHSETDETVSYWRQRLERELAQGRLRTEIAYIFGVLLEERLVPQPQNSATIAEQQTAQASLLQRAASASLSANSLTILDGFFADLGVAGEAVAGIMQETFTQTILAPIQQSELNEALGQISVDTYRGGDIRQSAHAIMQDKTLLKELADALTISIEHLDEWEWPQSGVPVHTAFANTKWRLFLDEDLPTSCLLLILGGRWQAVLDDILGRNEAARLKRLARLIELNAPEIILENERRMLQNAAGLRIILDAPVTGEAAGNEIAVGNEKYFYGESHSIAMQRSTLQDGLRDFGRIDSYGAAEAAVGMDSALMFVNAEIRLARAAFPDQPFYVIKADLRDFYPSLSHGVLLALLERLQFPPRAVAFFRRYLATPLAVGDQVIVAHSGVPNHRPLSDMLGELVLRLLDQYLLRAANVRVIRMIDDICILAASAEEGVKAWQALQTFYAACALSLNEEKCGAVAIGGTLPPELPATAPTWFLLQIDNQGEWQVDGDAFDRYRDLARDEIMRTTSILDQVSIYNRHLAYLEKTLALRAPLGEVHRHSVGQALIHFYNDFFGERQGIATRLRQNIQQRYQGGEATIRIPEAWLYWPITAGGLSLRQANLLGNSYAEALARRKFPEQPRERGADWLYKNNDWSDYYAAFTQEIQPVTPLARQVMETLVNDFIRRGTEVSNRTQHKIGVYWRWVLYLYGPQILEHFGSFRFLLTELVPFQVIVSGRLDDLSLHGTGEADDIPF
jgi:hypothetical protein